MFWAIPQASLGEEHWAVSGYVNAQSEDAYARAIPRLAFYPYRVFLDPVTLVYYKTLIKNFGFLPFFSPETLFMIFPSILKNVLSDNGIMRGIFEHYSAVPTAILFVSAIFGINNIFWLIKHKLEIIVNARLLKIGLTMMVFLLSIRSFLLMSPLPINPSADFQVYKLSSDSEQLADFLRKIPAAVSVTASPEIRPHLTHKAEIYPMPWKIGKSEYLVFTTHNRLFFDHSKKDFESKLLFDLENGKKYPYELVKKFGDFYVYKKT